MQPNAGQQDPGFEEITADNFHQSPQWHEVQNIYLHVIPDHDYCAACNLTGDGMIQVHHIVPVEFCYALGREDLTVNPLNMISLCEGPHTNDHHVALGHLGDFHWYNPMVKEDVVGPWRTLPEVQIKLEQEWQARQVGAIPLHMSQQQRDELNAFILQTFGPKPAGTLDDWVAQLRQSVHSAGKAKTNQS